MKQATLTAAPESVQQQICELLGWTEQQYSQFMYECGLAYLKAYLPDYCEIAGKFESSRVFWNWYKRLHARLDATIVDDEGVNHFAQIGLANRLEIYQNVHDASANATEWRVNKIVWQDVMP